jgi:hypothetical protein
MQLDLKLASIFLDIMILMNKQNLSVIEVLNYILELSFLSEV